MIRDRLIMWHFKRRDARAHCHAIFSLLLNVFRLFRRLIYVFILINESINIKLHTYYSRSYFYNSLKITRNVWNSTCLATINFILTRRATVSFVSSFQQAFIQLNGVWLYTISFISDIFQSKERKLILRAGEINNRSHNCSLWELSKIRYETVIKRVLLSRNLSEIDERAWS